VQIPNLDTKPKPVFFLGALDDKQEIGNQRALRKSTRNCILQREKNIDLPAKNDV